MKSKQNLSRMKILRYYILGTGVAYILNAKYEILST